MRRSGASSMTRCVQRPLILALLALSCAGPLDRTPAVDDLAGAVRLRLVAGNLSSGNNQTWDAGEGLRILRGLHPDVVMVQEFNYGAGTYQSFADSVCGAPCYYARETVAGSGTIPNGVVSRYPIKSSGRWTDSSVSNRGFAWARIDIPGPTDLWVVSVHLLTDTTRHATEGSELVDDIRALVPAGDYVAIGGDFNTALRTDAAVTALGSIFVAGAPWPADQAGNQNTNASRGKPYDWVLVSGNLDALQAPVTVGASSFSGGLVADTRVYTPIADLA